MIVQLIAAGLFVVAVSTVTWAMLALRNAQSRRSAAAEAGTGAEGYSPAYAKVSA